MEIPKHVTETLGITEDEVIQIVIDAANRIGPKYAFGYYDADDLIQEATIIGMKALKSYKKGPLQNFINSHISKRMKNFKRDNYYRPGAANAEAKMAIMNMLDITSIDYESEDNMKQTHDYVSTIWYKEVKDKIDKELPVSYRRDYLRMKDGDLSGITPKRKKEIITKIQEIVGVNDDGS